MTLTLILPLLLFCSVQFIHSVVSNSLWPHGLQHARPPCPSPTPRAYSNSCPLSQWCHPTISFSVVPFSSCLQSFPASGSFQISQFFASGGQSIGISASASVPPMNIQDWFPSGWTGWISLQSKGLSRLLLLEPYIMTCFRESTCEGLLGSETNTSSYLRQAVLGDICKDRIVFLFCFFSSPPSLINKRNWHPGPNKVIILRH